MDKVTPVLHHRRIHDADDGPDGQFPQFVVSFSKQEQRHDLGAVTAQITQGHDREGRPL